MIRPRTGIDHRAPVRIKDHQPLIRRASPEETPAKVLKESRGNPGPEGQVQRAVAAVASVTAFGSIVA